MDKNSKFNKWPRQRGWGWGVGKGAKVGKRTSDRCPIRGWNNINATTKTKFESRTLGIFVCYHNTDAPQRVCWTKLTNSVLCGPKWSRSKATLRMFPSLPVDWILCHFINFYGKTQPISPRFTQQPTGTIDSPSQAQLIVNLEAFLFNNDNRALTPSWITLHC